MRKLTNVFIRFLISKCLDNTKVLYYVLRELQLRKITKNTGTEVEIDKNFIRLKYGKAIRTDEDN
jgi:hypothetical protein